MIGGVTRSGLPLIYLGSPTPCKQGLSKWKGEEGGGGGGDLLNIKQSCI